MLPLLYHAPTSSILVHIWLKIHRQIQTDKHFSYSFRSSSLECCTYSFPVLPLHAPAIFFVLIDIAMACFGHTKVAQGLGGNLENFTHAIITRIQQCLRTGLRTREHPSSASTMTCAKAPLEAKLTEGQNWILDVLQVCRPPIWRG